MGHDGSWSVVSILYSKRAVKCYLLRCFDKGMCAKTVEPGISSTHRGPRKGPTSQPRHPVPLHVAGPHHPAVVSILWSLSGYG